MGRWGSWGAGCGCCPSACNQRFLVTLCGSPATGATVTVKDSSFVTVGSAVTDATGHCSVPLAASGSYSGTASGPAVNTKNFSFSATCPVPTDVPVSVNPSNTYGCCGSNALPSTLYLTDAQGTHPLVLQPASGTWSAGYNATLPGTAVYDPAGSGLSCTQTETGTVSIGYTMSCSGGTFQMEEDWGTIECQDFDPTSTARPYQPTSYPISGVGKTGQITSATATSTSSPLNLAFTFPSTVLDSADNATTIPVPFTSCTVTT